MEKTIIKLEQYSSDGEYCLIIPDEIVDKFMCNEQTDIVISFEDRKIIIKNKHNEQ